MRAQKIVEACVAASKRPHRQGLRVGALIPRVGLPDTLLRDRAGRTVVRAVRRWSRSDLWGSYVISVHCCCVGRMARSMPFGLCRSDDAGFFLARVPGLRHAIPKSGNSSPQHSRGRQDPVADADPRCQGDGRAGASGSGGRHLAIRNIPNFRSLQSWRVSMDGPGSICDRGGSFRGAQGALLSDR